MKKVIANLEEAAPSIEFVGTVTSIELYRLAESLKQMAAALETLSGNKPGNVIVKEAVNAPVIYDAPSPLKITPKIGSLEEFLNQRGIKYKLKEAPNSQEYEKNLDDLALYLGQNFDVCKEIYQTLKKSMVTPQNPIVYSLQGLTIEQNTRIRAFCRLLTKAQILEDYIYTGKPECKIQLKPTGKEQKYLSGAWLENYVKVEVERIVQENFPGKEKYNYQALSNLEILYQTDKKSELDLFFAVGRKVFCIEAKTRPTLAALKNSCNLFSSLGIDSNHIMFVSAFTDEENCKKFSNELQNVRIARLINFEETLTSMLKATL